MNYQHAYHAGNFADVMKHCLLIQLLDQLIQKGKPFYALDAYGGRGYSLASDEAKKTGEAQLGINKLLQADRTDAPQAVQHFLDGIQSARQTYDQYVYPGSPYWLTQAVKANPDLAIRTEAFEAKASEYDALNYQLYKLPIGIHPHRNAFEGIPAVIPPAERRGIILIDPPYEQEHKDFTRLVDLLVASTQKWSQGIYALWYPLKNRDAVELFHKNETHGHQKTTHLRIIALSKRPCRRHERRRHDHHQPTVAIRPTRPSHPKLFISHPKTDGYP